ncbi:PucR family transcriptional regulator [Microbacterium lushaniae]|nr:PucR family transcriptional regulator [Microbacterium lushaniae]KAA9155751.1 PucR family transcriptional regulator [Microbacterium lushaniae]
MYIRHHRLYAVASCDVERTGNVVDPSASAATVRALLSRGDLKLRLATPEAALDAAALDRAARWVHSSDLADPTPFLSEGLVLLTTGTQFAEATDDEHAHRGYVRRLQERGVVALGFGSEVVRDGIPPLLEAACLEARLPLFEVPYRTPFIAVARANAEAIAAESYARRTWALAAQRAVALAALRPDGLDATLAELARQLGAWVGLYDATGDLRREHPAGQLDAATRDGLDAEVSAVLRRGARAGSALHVGDTPFSLQTLGRGGHLRGVLAIASGHLDAESRAVVTSVIAMAGLALEQNDGLQRAQGVLRAGVIHALLAGDVALARRFVRELGGALPPAPTAVCVVEGTAATLDNAAEWLAVIAATDPVVFGRGPDGLVVGTAPDSPLADELVDRFPVRVGVSAPAAWAEFARAHDQARAALRRQRGAVARFGETAASGVLGALDSDLARVLAAASLAPLTDHDAARGTELLPTLRAWLEHDARIDAAAAALGVHRHTVRTRIAQAESVLGSDLSSFPARAELWAALQVSGL